VTVCLISRLNGPTGYGPLCIATHLNDLWRVGGIHLTWSYADELNLCHQLECSPFDGAYQPHPVTSDSFGSGVRDVQTLISGWRSWNEDQIKLYTAAVVYCYYAFAVIWQSLCICTLGRTSYFHCWMWRIRRSIAFRLTANIVRKQCIRRE
jgi:hypothetical protein